MKKAIELLEIFDNVVINSCDNYNILGCCGFHVITIRHHGSETIIYARTILGPNGKVKTSIYDPKALSIDDRRYLIRRMARQIKHSEIAKILNLSQSRVSQILQNL